MIKGSVGHRRRARKVQKMKRVMTPAIAEAVLAAANVKGALQLILQRGKQNGRSDLIKREARAVLGIDESGAGPALPSEQLVIT